MPTFAFTVSNYTPFTKILSANINSDRSDIKTFLNTTKLDDANIQNAGITPTTKLNATGSSAGQILGSNGTAVVWTTSNLQTLYNVIIGSAAQVTAGTATHSSYASYSASAADGDRILVLPGYATNEAWSIAKKVLIEGLGNTSVIQGAVTFASGANSSRMSKLQVQNSVTINSGVTGLEVDVWLSGTNTFTDNNSSISNWLLALQG